MIYPDGFYYVTTKYATCAVQVKDDRVYHSCPYFRKASTGKSFSEFVAHVKADVIRLSTKVERREILRKQKAG